MTASGRVDFVACMRLDTTSYTACAPIGRNTYILLPLSFKGQTQQCSKVVKENREESEHKQNPTVSAYLETIIPLILSPASYLVFMWRGLNTNTWSLCLYPSNTIRCEGASRFEVIYLVRLYICIA